MEAPKVINRFLHELAIRPLLSSIYSRTKSVVLLVRLCCGIDVSFHTLGVPFFQLAHVAYDLSYFPFIQKCVYCSDKSAVKSMTFYGGHEGSSVYVPGRDDSVDEIMREWEHK